MLACNATATDTSTVTVLVALPRGPVAVKASVCAPGVVSVAEPLHADASAVPLVWSTQANDQAGSEQRATFWSSTTNAPNAKGSPTDSGAPLDGATIVVVGGGGVVSVTSRIVAVVVAFAAAVRPVQAGPRSMIRENNWTAPR